MIKDKWEKFGEENPYYAVLTLDRFNSGKLTEDRKAEFFKTGEDHIERIWDEIKNHFEKDFEPKNAIDFGCGVGRLVIPLAGKVEKVVGIDISEQMLFKADENCRNFGYENTEFFLTDDFLKLNKEKFDLIHSTIVFQHINPKIGLGIFENLVQSLNEKGVGVFNFVYKNPASKLKSLMFKMYRDIPGLHKIRNIIKGDNQALFPMYEYDLNEVFFILQKNNCHKSFIRYSYHGMNGVVIFFQKQKDFIY